MRAKLRQVGNSVGLTIPASELRAMEAEVGDMVELEIKQVIRPARHTWDNRDRWQGVEQEPLLLEDELETGFDKEEWQW